MDKKAATHVVAFLLSDGVIKMASNDIVVKHVASYLHGEMKANGMTSILYGFLIGS